MKSDVCHKWVARENDVVNINVESPSRISDIVCSSIRDLPYFDAPCGRGWA